MSRRHAAIQARVLAAATGETPKIHKPVSGVVRRMNTLTDKNIADALTFAGKTAQPERDKLLILLTCRLGLRIGEASQVYVEDILDANGDLREKLWVSARHAKYGKEREVPMNRDDVRDMLLRYLSKFKIKSGPLFFDQYGSPLKAAAGAKQVAWIYKSIGLRGCASHSGRRTFGTRSARYVTQKGGTLKDVMKLLGHRQLETTEAYIDYTPIQDDIVANI